MEMTIKSYVNQLSSSSPTPGGGGTSALFGALGSALGSMVAALTTGKRKYAEYEEDIQKILAETARFNQQFLELMEADEKAFAPLSRAYGISKDDPARDSILEEALKGAAEPPVQVLHTCSSLIEVLEELDVKGSRLAVSDAACGAAACEAAAKAASMNIFINTKLLKDRSYAQELNRAATAEVENICSRCEALQSQIRAKLLTSQMNDPAQNPWFGETPEFSPVRQLRGMPVVKSMCAALVPRLEALKERGIIPKLTILRVGANPDDLSYEKGILKRFHDNGAEVEVKELSPDVNQETLETLILSLNKDCSTHGILLFRPLPKTLDEKRISALIAPEKDVDGMGECNLAGVFAGRKDSYPPCTPQAVVELLDGYGIDCTGKRVVIVGRSVVVGKPLSMLLLQKNATVTVCHTQTKDLAAECRRADILIACAGVTKMITPEFTNPNQIVVDVGINFADGKLCGDVDYDAVAPLVAGISPVPGGVGTITSTVILKHTVMGAESRKR